VCNHKFVKLESHTLEYKKSLTYFHNIDIEIISCRVVYLRCIHCGKTKQIKSLIPIKDLKEIDAANRPRQYWVKS